MRFLRLPCPRTLALASGAGLALLLAAGSPARAQSVDFQLFRYDDDVSSLALEAREGRYTFKYVPLASDSWVSFGGELRTRLERTSAPSLGQLGSGADTYGLHRALLHADLHLGEDVRAFVQLGAFLTTDKDVALPPARDDLDVQQAFLEIRRPLGEATASARLGRQELAFGSQRLIGIRDGPNARRAFDGARLAYKSSALRLDVLALRPVAQAPGVFDNRTKDDEDLYGVYATLPAAPGLPGALDLYALGYEREQARFTAAAGRERRWSWGARAFGRQGAWDWDVEATVQTGDLGSEDIFAWGLASDWGYHLPRGTWDVRLGLKADIASGDADPADGELNTANAMYPKLPYLGSAGAFAPSNIIDLQPSLTFARKDFSLTVGYQAIWRQTPEDAVYVAPLIALPRTAGRGGRFTAHQWPIDILWRPSRHWQVDAALSWVKVSEDLKDAGAKDSAFAFASVTYRF